MWDWDDPGTLICAAIAIALLLLPLIAEIQVRRDKSTAGMK